MASLHLSVPRFAVCEHAPRSHSCSSLRRRCAEAPRLHQGRLPSFGVMRAVPEPNEDVSDAMKADLDRFQRKAETKPDARASSANNSRWQAAAEPEPESLYYTLKDGLDKILIADFFLVLAILAWLVAGVAQNSALHSSSLLDAWYPLWPLVWQPAIGVLMAGALVSGGTNWVQQQLQEMQQKDKKGGR